MSLLRESWQATGEGTDALLQAAREVRMCESAHIDMRWEAYELEIGLMRHGLVLPDRRIEVGEYMIEHVAPSVDIDRQVTLHQRLALTMREFGRLVDAIPHHMEALRLAEAVSVERRANLLLGLSAHYSHLGDFRRAAELAVEAETLLENEPDLLLARILARQAQIIEQQATLGEIDSLGMAFGLAQGERARDMIAAVDDESARLRHGSFAEVTVSRMLAALGRDDEAADAARAAAEYAREAGNSRLLMQRLVMQADIEITRGGYREARDILEEVLDLVGPDPAWAGRAHLLFGRVHLALEDSTLAAHHFQEAIASVEAQRADLGVTEWSLLRLSLHDSAYRDYAGLLLQQGRDEEAFGWLDAERARYLRDVRRLARMRDDEETFSMLAAELRSVEDSIRIAGTRHSLELSTRRAQLQAQMARLSGYEPIEPQVDLPALQRRLGRDGRVLVSYFLGTPAHADRSWVSLMMSRSMSLSGPGLP